LFNRVFKEHCIMRIGIVPFLNRSGGGIYQYSVTMLRALGEWKDKMREDEFILFADQAAEALELNPPGWTLKSLTPQQSSSFRDKLLDKLRALVGEGPHREAWRHLRARWNGTSHKKQRPHDPDRVHARPSLTRWFESCGVDFMLYAWPNRMSFESGIPYVMAIHDVQHRLQPEFPEVSANGEWESREYYFRNGARYATLILADSEVGKEDILNCYGPYGLTTDRVKVLPFLPACYLAQDVPDSERQRMRIAYRLPERYLFYPAQFWPHKNHARIVQALGLLKQRNRRKFPIVFCGGNDGPIRKRTFQEVRSLASKFGLEKEIYNLGYVPDKDMSALYAGAVALVMPTFFGPTNIPILEAWAFGCPVLTSDIRGIREQAGDAAILVNPRSVEAIAEGIEQLWSDEELRRALAARGRQRLASYTPGDFSRRLIEIVAEAKERVRLRKRQGAQRSPLLAGEIHGTS
jgi:glycosyltransferase involved in cell wall biosynthesis